MAATQHESGGWRLVKGQKTFATIQAVAAFDLPVADQIIGKTLLGLVPRQQKNGTFGGPNRVERVAAVMLAVKAIESPDK